MPTQESLDEETLAAVRTGVVVSRRFHVMLQCLQIGERRLAHAAAVILFSRLLLLDGVSVLMKPEVRQGVKRVAAHVTAVLGTLVAASVLEKILEFGEHHAAAVLHAFVHLQRQVRND